MTKELEALNILRENHIQFTKEKYGNLDKGKLQNIINRKLARWIILEEALKRNEPMKVKLKTHLQDMNDGETIGLCPNCNRFVKDIYKRCPDCGQAIDWSDDK